MMHVIRTNKVVGIDMGRQGVYKLSGDDTVLMAPEDWETAPLEQYDNQYWLNQADILRI